MDELTIHCAMPGPGDDEWGDADDYTDEDEEDLLDEEEEAIPDPDDEDE